MIGASTFFCRLLMNLPFPSNNTKYRPDIDGLRAIAIILVVADHVGIPGASGGFIGVDIFFVISGFLITSLLFDEMVTQGRIALGTFYARRVRRLMPAGLLVVLVTLLLGALLMPAASDEQRSLAASAKSLAYFGSNFYFFKNTGGYFDGPAFGMPLLHTWSLAVEEQYYLAWPFVMLLVSRLSGGSQSRESMRRRIVGILGGMLLLSLALSAWATPDNQKFTFFLLPARVWEFAAGGMVGLAGRGFFSRLRSWADAVAVAGLAMITYATITFGHDTSFPGWIAVIPVVGTAALIAGMTANEHSQVRRLLSARPLVAVGLLSYSWYLWHWPLISIYRIRNFGAQDIGANVLVAGVALILAWLTFLWVERPIRVRRLRLFVPVRSTLILGVGISLMTILGSAGLSAWYKYQLSTDETAKARYDYPPYQKYCSVTQAAESLPGEECVYGPDKHNPKVLLWGDSHADHMMAMLMAAFPREGVYQVTMPGCVPAIGYESRIPHPSKNCADFNRRVLEKIADLKKNGLDSVVISARWPSYLWHPSISVEEQGAGAVQFDPERMRQAQSRFAQAFEATLVALESMGVRVLVLPPTPELVFHAPRCISLGGGPRCDVARQVNESLTGASHAVLSATVARHPNARLAQLMDFFCDEQTCYAMRYGKVLYFDDDHITVDAARRLADYLSGDIVWLKRQGEKG